MSTPPPPLRPVPPLPPPLAVGPDASAGPQVRPSRAPTWGTDRGDAHGENKANTGDHTRQPLIYIHTCIHTSDINTYICIYMYSPSHPARDCTRRLSPNLALGRGANDLPDGPLRRSWDTESQGSPSRPPWIRNVHRHLPTSCPDTPTTHQSPESQGLWSGTDAHPPSVPRAVHVSPTSPSRLRSRTSSGVTPQ